MTAGARPWTSPGPMGRPSSSAAAEGVVPAAGVGPGAAGMGMEVAMGVVGMGEGGGVVEEVEGWAAVVMVGPVVADMVVVVVVVVLGLVTTAGEMGI